MATSRENFKINIKQLLFTHDISCAALSRELHVAPTTVREWKNGTNFPRDAMLDKIANFFNISTEDLLKTPKENQQIVVKNELQGYDELNSHNKQKVLEFIQFLRTNEATHDK